MDPLLSFGCIGFVPTYIYIYIYMYMYMYLS